MWLPKLISGQKEKEKLNFRESSGTDDDVTEYGGYDGDGRYEVPQTRLPEAALFSQDRDRDRDQTKKPR